MSSCRSRGVFFPPSSPSPKLASLSPIDRAPAIGARNLTGDDFSLPHALLWNRDAFLAERTPVSSERAPLVVIGGGVSGLLSGYYLRKHQPIILEQATRFGGNAKGEAWGTLPYALGAAYVTQPGKGTPHAQLFEELNLAREWSIKTEEDPVEFQGTVHQAFWENSKNLPDQTLHRYLLDVFNENGYHFPEIPVIDKSRRSEIDELDRVSFLEHLTQQAAGPLSIGALTAIEQYCWSSFGGSAREISAASGLNFYAGECGPVIVMPGGNARIAERLFEEIADTVPTTNLRPQSLVLEVSVTHGGVVVRYVDAKQQLREVIAQAVVCACPKFVVKKILSGIEPTRSDAIARLSYRAYLVGNVLLNSRPPSRFYDLYLLGQGHTSGLTTQEEALRAGVTDVILANYAHHDQDRAVLTLYQALPFDGGRPWLFSQSADQLIRHFETQTITKVLPTLGIPSSAVVDLRVTRWGHALPLAATGLIATGVTDTIRAPFRERVFFVEQDNWALPALETCIAEAAEIAGRVDATLR